MNRQQVLIGLGAERLAEEQQEVVISGETMLVLQSSPESLIESDASFLLQPGKNKHGRKRSFREQVSARGAQ